MVERDVKIGVPQFDGRRRIAWPEGMADVLHHLHAEVWVVQVSRVQLLQVENAVHAAIFLGDEKNGADVAWRNLFNGSLGKEGLHLLVDEMIVLALRGCRPGKARGGGGSKMGAEARHSFQGVWSATKAFFSKRREVLETAPHPLDCMKRGEAERGNERSRPGAAGGTGSTGARNCPTHSPNRHVTQLRAGRTPRFLLRWCGRPLEFPDFLAGDLAALGFWC
jgi:hypothetical protein